MKTVTESFDVFTYDELDSIKQHFIVNSVINGWIECPDIVPEQAYNLYEKAGEKSEQMRTPWFFGEYIWEYCKDFVLHEAKQSYYLASGEWYSLIDE